ncbi:MAG: ABC transporter ATP-binding protein [Candidatus Acetothermia bacterium]|jgi:peptide/nickel transport system ATP-binding protein|nr:ABC transporter ATP-binding protein [Candidatus Acetothermia bacterium]MDH7505457.1 ABC transporter ATP-binding protein [Candidatus Acetothermia bacterium]
MADPILSVERLKKHFPTKLGLVKAVDGISLSVAAGETIGLVGESGSGKTTVAQCIVGIYPPTDGEIRFRGQPISRELRKRSKDLKREIRIVFQDPGSSLNPKRTISQILSVPLKVHRNARGRSRTAMIRNLLEMVELPPDEYLHKYPQSIGGGEKQMVAIARALATSPSFVVLDEPTSALDVSVQAKIINLLLELQTKLSLTYLFITHDLSLMRNVATRVAIMYLGKICEVAPTVEFFRNPLHPYTKMLLSSIPVVSEEEKALKPAKILSRGEIPSPVNVPPGCSFHLRCPMKMEICSEADPEMVEVEPDHLARCHLLSRRS